MSIFDGVQNDTSVEEEKDQVRGQRREPLPSNIENCMIKYAYGKKSRGGAMGIHLVLEAVDHDKREIKVTEYITGGDSKGNKTFYEKDGKKYNLPGFSAIDALCNLVAGKGILSCDSTKKSIPLYDFDAKKEIPTEVDMLMDLVGQPVKAAILHVIEDKTKKNDQTGNYEPTGQTYGTNLVDKFFRAADSKTHSEAKNNIEADFAKKWLDKWKDQVDDRSSDVKDAGMKGAPAPSGDSAEKTSLFGD
jgi:hypothetical protein